MKTQKKIEPINVYAKDESAEYTHLVISRKVNELVDAYNDSVEAAQSLKGVNPFPLFLADKDKNMTYLKQLFTYLRNNEDSTGRSSFWSPYSPSGD